MPWFSRLIAWLEEDTRKTKAANEETWSKTDLGKRGVSRDQVGFWRRMTEVFNAAKKGKY